MTNGNPGQLRQRNSDWLEGRASIAEGDAVLIVDDSETDIFFLLRAFAVSKVRNPVFVVRSAGEAIDYLEGRGKFENRGRYPFPRIVFLDLRMPDRDGVDVLRWKQKHPNLPRVLWVAMSNFQSPRAINEAYAAGASTFLIKPIDGAEVRNLIDAFEDYWQVHKELEMSNS